ncbi:unnamed protein product [Brassica oleracea var. botrytis]
MALSYIFLSDLKSGRCSNTAEVRLLRFWEARNTGKQLPDIIGEVNAIRSTITDRIPGAQRVMLTLRLESGENVCVSMFDSMALAFHTKFDSYKKEPRIVVATSINPKIVGAASKEVFDTLPGEGTYAGSGSSKVVHAQKIEPVTVSELNQFVISAEPQIIEFLCTAKVTGIQTEEGWCYIGCATCSKKLVRETASFTCVPCNDTNAVAALRLLRLHKLGVGVDAQVDTDLPVSLAGVVGKTYTFLSEHLRPYQPLIYMYDGGKVAEEVHPGDVPQETDGQVGNPGAGANKPSTSATASDKRPQQAKADSDVDENARKKAHVG